MQKYVFREDETLAFKASDQADAQKIGSALEKISAANNGELKPKAVVDAARDSKHPLHKHFEWSDSIAAEAFRLEQARSIIRVVRVVDEDVPDGKARAFVSIRTDEGVSYRSHKEVKSSADLQQALLRQAERELEAFEHRYREFKDVCSLVSQAKDAVRRRRNKNENRAAA